MSRIVVLGAGGMLGHKLCQRLAGHEVVGLVRRPVADYRRYREVFADTQLIGGVDVRDAERLAARLDELGPAAVVNCVGLVKQLPEAADVALAVYINSFLPHHLAGVCGEIGARLVHVSTDCVFDGRRGGYAEDDIASAVDLYGRSKALGETTASETAAVTLRTSFIGRELSAQTHGLVEWFLAQDGGRVQGFERVIYSGVTSIELAKVIARVVAAERPPSGVHHVASAPINKYELLRLVRRSFGSTVEIEPSERPVSDRSLQPGALLAELGHRIPGWPEMIEEMSADPTPYDAWRSAVTADAADSARSPD